MSSFEEVNFRKILLYYSELGEKKLLKNSLKKLNINKKVYLHYSKNKNIPICALPKLRIILTSKQGFLSFCYNFFTFANTYSNNNIHISLQNIKSISKFVISHEVGHILDPDISLARVEYSNIISNIVDKLIEYNIDINDNNFYKYNLPTDLEICVLDLKKNLIDRESKAWDIAKTILVFDDKNEEHIFNKIKEYALATYNFGNLKNIVIDNNLDIFFKYKRYFV
ncbi:hypothetical protein CHF27_000725 [Romboutsia maritimum]|uniref:Uncharacterized protein n=1 Tax=Romboutsia maritimum TaxID=2020948 RepID=A0A371IW93_9FIRM|nr:hypothetical protein [Romboutsia maritimum]RDY24754.1 hypothetical protein CHF27_000725 [Romboutsia maritimum]